MSHDFDEEMLSWDFCPHTSTVSIIFDNCTLVSIKCSPKLEHVSEFLKSNQENTVYQVFDKLLDPQSDYHAIFFPKDPCLLNEDVVIIEDLIHELACMDVYSGAFQDPTFRKVLYSLNRRDLTTQRYELDLERLCFHSIYPGYWIDPFAFAVIPMISVKKMHQLSEPLQNKVASFFDVTFPLGLLRQANTSDLLFQSVLPAFTSLLYSLVRMEDDQYRRVLLFELETQTQRYECPVLMKIMNKIIFDKEIKGMKYAQRDVFFASMLRWHGVSDREYYLNQQLKSSFEHLDFWCSSQNASTADHPEKNMDMFIQTYHTCFNLMSLKVVNFNQYFLQILSYFLIHRNQWSASSMFSLWSHTIKRLKNFVWDCVHDRFFFRLRLFQEHYHVSQIDLSHERLASFHRLPAMVFDDLSLDVLAMRHEKMKAVKQIWQRDCLQKIMA